MDTGDGDDLFLYLRLERPAKRGQGRGGGVRLDGEQAREGRDGGEAGGKEEHWLVAIMT